MKHVGYVLLGLLIFPLGAVAVLVVIPACAMIGLWEMGRDAYDCFWRRE
jgi:hypothetical protein